MIQDEIQIEGMAAERNAGTSRTETEVSLLEVVVLLVGHKRFIARFVLGAAALATVVSFLLPIRYEGKIVLLPPQQNSSLGSVLLSQLGSLGSLGSLASLAGGNLGVRNPSDMYVALLTSRTVEDGNPKRAAELANAYVEEFRKLSASLAITEAARRRLFFDQQVQQAREALTQAEEAMTKTQQSTGVLQIDSQARSLIESAAILRAQVVAKQVQIEGMRSFATDENPGLILAKQELAALRSQLYRLAGSQQDAGSDINLSKGRVTQSGMEYFRRYRDLKYQETVFELLAKQFEIAKLDEAREGSIIQVVDAAVPPDKKSSPHRLLIVIGVTILAFPMSVFWILTRKRWASTSGLPENRERLEAIKVRWKEKADMG